MIVKVLTPGKDLDCGRSAKDRVFRQRRNQTKKKLQRGGNLFADGLRVGGVHWSSNKHRKPGRESGIILENFA